MPRRPVPKGVERKRRPDPGAAWLHGLLDLADQAPQVEQEPPPHAEHPPPSEPATTRPALTAAKTEMVREV